MHVAKKTTILNNGDASKITPIDQAHQFVSPPSDGRVSPNASDQVDLVNPEGHRIVPGVRNLLTLGGPPVQVTIHSQYFFNKDLEYLVLGDKGRRSALSISKLKAAHCLDIGLEELVPSLWIEIERKYDISSSNGISHWWFNRKEFYITRHDGPFDRSKVRSHMRILSVFSLKTYKRYRYTFLKEIILRRADYKEYKISEDDFKNLNPNYFEDLMFKYNSSMTTRIWSEDDRRRSKELMEVIEHRLKIRRIFKSLKSFVGGRLRDVDYRLIQRTE
nr:hypothetical protein [Tanacetum cinerariifolium]GEX76211.1 hypothetical protein [Tanacetum cinerariifolium]